MRKNTFISLFLLVAWSIPSVSEEAPRALSVSTAELDGEIYNGMEPVFIEMFRAKVRSTNSFKSPDGKFSMGAFEMTMDETNIHTDTYDPFPRNEMMYFVKGGIKLTDRDGNVQEAGPGEFIFIPKGYRGDRIFWGQDGVMQKFAVVYYENDS